MIIGEVDGCIEESSGNKYLILVSTDKSKEVLSKYTEHCDRIKNLIEKTNNKQDKISWKSYSIQMIICL